MTKMHEKKTTEPQIRRSRLYVDTDVQGSLVRQLVIHWLLTCVLIFIYVLTLQVFAHGFVDGLLPSLIAVGHRFGLLGIALLVISPIFIYDSVKLSNRFVGPIVSFRRSLNQLAAGENPGPLRFRNGDYWHDLATELNRVAAEMKELRELRDSVRRGEQMLTDKQTTPPIEAPEFASTAG